MYVNGNVKVGQDEFSTYVNTNSKAVYDLTKSDFEKVGLYEARVVAKEIRGSAEIILDTENTQFEKTVD